MTAHHKAFLASTWHAFDGPAARMALSPAGYAIWVQAIAAAYAALDNPKPKT